VADGALAQRPAGQFLIEIAIVGLVLPLYDGG